MAAEVANPCPFQKAIDYLETERVILTNFTDSWKELSNHISSLEKTLQEKSETLEGKLLTLDSTTKETLELLATREESITLKESAAIQRIEELKQTELSEIKKHAGVLPRDASIATSLPFLCRKMDAGELCRFLIARRKDLVSIGEELEPAIAEAVDPASLVLNALEDFLFKRGDNVGLSDQRWACGMLIRALPADGRVATSPKERALVLAEAWKEKIDASGEGGLASNAAEVQIFLQVVVNYQLVNKFEYDYLRKLVVAFASRRDMPKLASSLGLKEKIGDIIQELIADGKELDAVYFIYEFGLSSQFPPVPLLKAYLKNTRKNANGSTKGGSADEASELIALKAMLRCIEDHKLESEFSPESVRKRAAQLGKAKMEKKKFSGPPKLHKRSRTSGVGGGSVSFPPAKAGRHANPYASSTWRTQTLPTTTHQKHAAYTPAYTGYDYPYMPELSTGGSRSPATMPQRHYPYVLEDAATSHAAAVVAAAAATPYASATQPYATASANYSTYDYASAVPTYQAPNYLH